MDPVREAARAYFAIYDEEAVSDDWLRRVADARATLRSALDATSEVERAMRAVVEAAKVWRDIGLRNLMDVESDDLFAVERTLTIAVDALLAAERKEKP